MADAVELFRPVGTAELLLIEDARWSAFPPRLPDQPIFYPVTNLEYASMIARDWNVKYNEDHRGYVTRFYVRSDVANAYERRVVGGRECEELWVPADKLDHFNKAIIGKIEVVSEYGLVTQNLDGGKELK